MEERDEISLAQNGDWSAFEALVKRYEERVYRFVYFRVRNRADAEDISQDVFWRMYRSLRTFNNSVRFVTWLYTIARNAVRKHFGRRRSDSLVLSVEWLEELPQGADVEESATDRIQLWNAISHFSESDRMLLELRYLDDLPVGEIARIMKISEGTAKVRLHRCRERIGRYLVGGQNERKGNPENIEGFVPARSRVPD